MVRRTTFISIAKPVIVIMRKNDQRYRRQKEIQLMIMKKLLEDKKYKSGNKQEDRHKRTVMFDMTMKQRIGANAKSDRYHRPFKIIIMNDIDPK